MSASTPRPHRYGAEVVGLQLQILRTNGSWYHVKVEEYNETDHMHVLRFHDGSGNPVSCQSYDINHPARKVRWYDAENNLLPIGVPPPVKRAEAVGSPVPAETTPPAVEEVVWSRSGGARAARVDSTTSSASTTSRYNSSSSADVAPATSAGSAAPGQQPQPPPTQASSGGLAPKPAPPESSQSQVSASAPAKRLHTQSLGEAADQHDSRPATSARMSRIGSEVFTIVELPGSGALLYTSTASSARRFVRLLLRPELQPSALSGGALPGAGAGSSLALPRKTSLPPAGEESGQSASGGGGAGAELVVPDSSRLPSAPGTARSVEGGSDGPVANASGVASSTVGSNSGAAASHLAAVSGIPVYSSKLIRVYSPLAPAGRPPARPLPPPAEGWKAKQASVSRDMDPHGLLYRRVRVFWPMDNEWFAGRIQQYDATNDTHFVRYDDGDERWYHMRTKQYTLLPDYGPEIIGRRICVEWCIPSTHPAHPMQLQVAAASSNPGGSSPVGTGAGVMTRTASSATVRRWYAATVIGYDADLDMHQLLYDGKSKQTFEFANVHSRAHVWLVDVAALPAGEKILGRRISVLMPSSQEITCGTITEYRLGTALSHLSMTPAGTNAMVPVLQSSADPGAVVSHADSRVAAASAATATQTTAASSAARGTGTSPVDGSRDFSSRSARVSFECAAAELNAAGSFHLGAAATPAPSSAVPALAATAAASSLRMLPRRGSSGIMMLQPLKPDPSASVKIVFDDGDKYSVCLRDLQFCWVKDRYPGIPPAPGVVGLVNMGNTCYLNAILQCLSHVQQLTAYVLNDDFPSHINTRNKHGMQGRLAVAYRDLLEQLWSEPVGEEGPGGGAAGAVHSGRSSKGDKVDASPSEAPATETAAGDSTLVSPTPSVSTSSNASFIVYSSSSAALAAHPKPPLPPLPSSANNGNGTAAAGGAATAVQPGTAAAATIGSPRAVALGAGVEVPAPSVANMPAPAVMGSSAADLTTADGVLARPPSSNNSRQYSAIAPAFIKALLSERNSTFNGMGQQDAHEALMCLLDGVHEDLAVPDQAASAAASTDARVAAEEEAKEKADKDAKDRSAREKADKEARKKEAKAAASRGKAPGGAGNGGPLSSTSSAAGGGGATAAPVVIVPHTPRGSAPPAAGGEASVPAAAGSTKQAQLSSILPPLQREFLPSSTAAPEGGNTGLEQSHVPLAASSSAPASPAAPAPGAGTSGQNGRGGSVSPSRIAAPSSQSAAADVSGSSSSSSSGTGGGFWWSGRRKAPPTALRDSVPQLRISAGPRPSASAAASAAAAGSPGYDSGPESDLAALSTGFASSVSVNAAAPVVLLVPHPLNGGEAGGPADGSSVGRSQSAAALSELSAATGINESAAGASTGPLRRVPSGSGGLASMGSSFRAPAFSFGGLLGTRSKPAPQLGADSLASDGVAPASPTSAGTGTTGHDKHHHPTGGVVVLPTALPHSLALRRRDSSVPLSASADSKAVEGQGDQAAGASSAAVSTAVALVQQPIVETTSIIKQLFFVQMHTEFTCVRHKHVSVRHGPRGGEMLPPLPLVAGKREVKVQGGLWRRKAYRDPVLTDCLDDYFCSSESVERKCQRCGKVTTVMARPWLKELPPILVIQLKRFEFMPSTGVYAKITEAVSFPMKDLDMAPYVSNSPASPPPSSVFSSSSSSSAAAASAAAAPDYATNGDGPGAGDGLGAPPTASSSPSSRSSSKYDLFAIVVHAGGMERGHYTAYARLPSGEQWHYFDDSTVVPVSPSDVASQRVASLAYLLFYARQGV